MSKELAGNRVAWIGFQTLVIREITRILRIWPQTLVPPIITMSLYFVIFGQLIGQRIGSMGGVDYMSFIVPGLVMMAIITNAYGNVVSSFFGSKFGKYVEELLVSPMPPYVVLGGYVAGGVLRGLLIGLLVSLVAMFFTDIRIAHPWVMLATALLASTVFSMAGFINAVYAQKFDDIAIIPTFVLTPLTYLGGVFYSIDLLASPWSEISRLNPIVYMVSAFRYGMLGHSEIDLGVAFALMIGFLLLLGSICLWLLHKGVGLRS